MLVFAVVYGTMCYLSSLYMHTPVILHTPLLLLHSLFSSFFPLSRDCILLMICPGNVLHFSSVHVTVEVFIGSPVTSEIL